jgi:4-hydroxybenzoate polyprenyltransferase
MNTTIKDYISIFRPVRWYQNVLVILGGVLSLELMKLPFKDHWLAIVVAFVAICLVASGNYGLNEVLDAEPDSHHPQKKHRAIPSGRVSKRSALALTLLFYVLGFGVMLALGNLWALGILVIFFLGAILYNVEPLRFKDRPYLDFTFEAVNSPLRVLLGWYAVSAHIFPSSFILALWFLGIFLMAAKRFGDIRLMKDRAELEGYRKSQKYYTEEKLLIAMIAALGVFYYMLGALAMKYSVDLIVTMPFIVIWTIWFFHLAYEQDTVVKDPERIFEKKGFLAFSLVTMIVFVTLFVTKSSFLAIFK